MNKWDNLFDFIWSWLHFETSALKKSFILLSLVIYLVGLGGK